jgi:hypothetical protein
MVEDVVVDDDRLGAYEIAVYAVLARFADRDRSCWPSVATVAKRCRCSAPKVRAAMKVLVACGYLAVEARMDKAGDRTSNRYVLTVETVALVAGVRNVVAHPLNDVDHGTQPECVRVRNDVASNQNQIEPEPMNAGDPLFDAFWAAYPRKVNKAGARKAWHARMVEVKGGSASRGLAAQQVMQGLANYVKTVAGKEVDFVMHPATFVGPARRWEDYLTLGPKRVPSRAAGDTAANMAARERERRAVVEAIGVEEQDPAKVAEAEARAAALRRKMGLPTA